MNILFLDPFHGGSHAAVAEGFARHSQHNVTLLTLSIAGGWRWRMRGAAVTLARQLRAMANPHSFDLIVTTDMLDLATFLGLTRDRTANTPTAIYFHENQLTYPLPQGRNRDLSFPWINYTSGLAADAVLFNSDFHRRAFLTALPDLVSRFHDHQELDLIDQLAAKSHVLYPGVDLARLDLLVPPAIPEADTAQGPVILWNSRWEYDKNPQGFFDALAGLEQREVPFQLIVVGEHIDPQQPDFLAARERFGSRALAWGYAPDTETYAARLHQADIVVSTAIQEFFGISLVEAMYCGCMPIAPRRLSYPEVILAVHHDICLYDHAVGLVDRLEFAIRNMPIFQQQHFRASAARYDWSLMAPQYDKLFEQLCNAR